MNREGRGRDVKLIAFHLPQFHRTPENDAWWWEGFTEWMNVKKAVLLYQGHNQPWEPLEGHYYQLDDIDAIIRQMELAKRYGVYGFCFYHYCFNGKLLLKKPLECMRDYNGDKQPFFYMEVPGKEFYAGAFVDRDNTARKGNKGRTVMETTPEKFKKYLLKQRQKAMERGDDFIFISAWNEWGEARYSYRISIAVATSSGMHHSKRMVA